MKLLVTADLHYNLKQYDWLAAQAGEYDGVIIAGDLLDMGSYLTPDVQGTVVSKYLTKMRATVPVVASSGNHDADSKDDNDPYPAAWMQHLRYDDIHVDGDSFMWGDVLISVCPWWVSDQQRDQTLEKLRADRLKEKAFWIWIHHVPTQDSPVSWSGKKFLGEPALNSWIDELKPDLVFSGHIHNAPFYGEGSWKDKRGDTLIFNAGHELASVPTHLKVDLDQRRVEWYSSAESATFDF